MCPRPRRPKIAAMNNERPWQALIELDLRSDPITGRVRNANGNGSPFCGWLELIGAINQLRRSAAAAAPANPDSESEE